MASKKAYIILIAILLIFGLVMFVLFGVPNIKKEAMESVLIVGDNTTWVYKDQKWNNIAYLEAIEKYNWREFKVFEDNKELGNYYLWHDDKWYAFKENREALNIVGNFIAYDANYEMKLLDYEMSEVDDMTYVYQVLEENNLARDSEFSSIYKVSVDFDGDNTIEDFYLITNVFPIDFEPEENFGIAFMVKNGEIYTLYNEVGVAVGLNNCKPYYNTFIDTNNDNIYEVILSCGKYSTEGSIDRLYQFDENQFKLMVSNQ